MIRNRSEEHGRAELQRFALFHHCDMMARGAAACPREAAAFPREAAAFCALETSQAPLFPVCRTGLCKCILTKFPAAGVRCLHSILMKIAENSCRICCSDVDRRRHYGQQRSMETASRFIETAEERAELRQVAAAVEQAKTAAAAAEVIGFILRLSPPLPCLCNSRNTDDAALAQVQAKQAVVLLLLHCQFIRAAARF